MSSCISRSGAPATGTYYSHAYSSLIHNKSPPGQFGGLLVFKFGKTTNKNELAYPVRRKFEGAGLTQSPL